MSISQPANNVADLGTHQVENVAENVICETLHLGVKEHYWVKSRTYFCKAKI